MPKKNCTIQYRYLNEEKLQGKPDLKAMTVLAMRGDRSGQQIGSTAKARILDLDQDGSYVILNKITEPAFWDQNIFSGQLIHLQEGADVAAVLQSLDEDAEEFLLQQVNLGQTARVLKGALYFVAVGNHVGIIESQQVKGRTLERYLTMLLQRADILETGEIIMLNSSFRAEGGKRLTEAHEVSIRAERNSGPAAEEATRVLEEEAARVQREGATVFDVLRTLGWDEEAICRLQEEVPQDGWIEGFFRVVMKQRGGRRKPMSRAAIDEALRNIDASDLGLSGNGSEKGGLVKLSVVKPVQTEGALQNPTDAVEQIVNALREWAEAGKIDCTFE